MRPKPPKPEKLKAKEVKQLLADPRCSIHEELSKASPLNKFYCLPDDKVLFIPFESRGRGLLWDRQALESVFLKTEETTREEWEKQNWEEMRGIRTIDYNNSVFMAKASVEGAGKAITAMWPNSIWKKDVLGSAVMLSQRCACVFGLRGHSWALILTNPMATVFSSQDLESLSRDLGTVISYFVSDTCGACGYAIYKSGGLEEEFSGEDGGRNTSFRSSRRPKPAGTRDVWDFVDTFLQEQDAFDPGITMDYFLGYGGYRAGNFARLVNPGFTLSVGGKNAVSLPPIERLDYIEIEN